MLYSHHFYTFFFLFLCTFPVSQVFQPQNKKSAYLSIIKFPLFLFFYIQTFFRYISCLHNPDHSTKMLQPHIRLDLQMAFTMLPLYSILRLQTRSLCGHIVRIYWSFVEKTSAKQSMECKVFSNFQMSFLHLSQMDPLVEVSSGQEWYYIRSA